jgi:hypothetical protein
MTRSRSLAAVLLVAVAALPAATAAAAAVPETPAAHVAAARTAARRAAPRRRAATRRGATRRPASRGRARARRGARRPAKPRTKQLGLLATPDPFAPADKTPKLLFHVRNAMRGRSYRIMAHQVRGQPRYHPANPDTPQCSIAVGSTEPRRSPVYGDFPWGRTPADFTDPSDGYDAIGGTPCTGVWEGKLEELERPRRSLDFVLEVPSMAVDVVYRYG